MNFEVVGEISDVETIAAGSGIRDLTRLRRVYGRGRWRKLKGVAQVQLGKVESVWPSFTGTKRTASARGK